MYDRFDSVTRRRRLYWGIPLVVAVVLVWAGQSFAASASQWHRQWPRTDFSRTSVDLSEIRSGGPGKDGIPAIDKPAFISTADMLEKKWLSPREPVIGLVVNGDARAYPLRILMWHEIANDTVGGVPVTITYCPLCNSSIVFDRRIAGRVLDFGVSGNLRYSDMVMYDRQTESWWQQFLGEAIVGELLGTVLKMMPSRVESFERFARRAPQGKVMIPSGGYRRAYGRNPYQGYDTKRWPMLYQGSVPEGVKAMAYVLAVGKEAWTLDLIRRKKRIEAGDLLITWEAGQGSALDTSDITEGRDIGNIIVKRRTKSGYVDAIHDLTFAFVFHAFVRDGKLNK